MSPRTPWEALVARSSEVAAALRATGSPNCAVLDIVGDAKCWSSFLMPQEDIFLTEGKVDISLVLRPWGWTKTFTDAYSLGFFLVGAPERSSGK